MNFTDRVLCDVEKNRFIALPGRGRHSSLMAPNLCVPSWEGLVKSLIANGSRVGLLIRLGCVQDLLSFGLQWSPDKLLEVIKLGSSLE